MLLPKPWQPERVAWLLVAFLAANLLGMIVVQGYSSALSKEEVKEPINVLVMLAGTLMYQGVTLVLIGVFLRMHKIRWSDAFGFTTKRIARTLGLAVLATAFILPITMALGEVSKLILEGMGQQPEIQGPVKALQSAETLQQQIYFAVVTVFVAPFVEEVMFRGILYPSFKQIGFPKFALWSTSIFFAVSHVNAVAFIPLLFMAVILTFLYETTENLIAPIVTHALFNATNFALLLHRMSELGT
jgi:membrane protease YdiL (CAAX protease family)